MSKETEAEFLTRELTALRKATGALAVRLLRLNLWRQTAHPEVSNFKGLFPSSFEEFKWELALTKLSLQVFHFWGASTDEGHLIEDSRP